MIVTNTPSHGYQTVESDLHDAIHDFLKVRIGERDTEPLVNAVQADMHRTFALGLKAAFQHSLDFIDAHCEALGFYFARYADQEATSELESA